MKLLRLIIKNLPGNGWHIKYKKIASGVFRRADLYFMDRSRFGLKAITLRALAPKDIKAGCFLSASLPELFYLFGAYAPTSGHHLTLELPRCNGDIFQLWVEQFSGSLGEGILAIVLLDNGAFHKRKALVIPTNT